MHSTMLRNEANGERERKKGTEEAAITTIYAWVVDFVAFDVIKLQASRLCG